ncbi:hypothetical protein RIF29_22500 [Crotalaria pallida]|uniref:Uncharacterized protein n=1 Tax=Crotalaria pallida TaxID=3830 RepID=A0AAN9F755_CROPI
MKRQRGGGNVNPPKVEKEVAAHAMGKKKAKKDVEQKKVVKSIVDQEEKEEERKEIKGEDEQVVAGDNNNNNDNAMGWNFEEHMPWLGGVVDEQMSWGSTWFPWWDMDFNGDAFSSLYNDVVWDDDIWNHNKEIPITLDRKV